LKKWLSEFFQGKQEDHKMVLLNSRPSRVTLEEALDILDIFDSSLPCWIADDVVAMIADALIERLLATGSKGPLANTAWDTGRWVN
jgi:hypothetical protein